MFRSGVHALDGSAGPNTTPATIEAAAILDEIGEALAATGDA
jgi:hypothetical protein